MTRIHPLYTAILLATILLLASAFYTVYHLEVGMPSSTTDTFPGPAIEQPPFPPSDLPKVQQTLSAIQKARQKQKPIAVFQAHHKLPRYSSASLKQAYKQTTNPNLKINLVIGLAQKGQKQDASFLLNIYRQSKNQARRRWALMGLARADPNMLVEICEKEIFGKKPPSLSWQRHGLNVLTWARNKRRKGTVKADFQRPQKCGDSQKGWGVGEGVGDDRGPGEEINKNILDIFQNTSYTQNMR